MRRTPRCGLPGLAVEHRAEDLLAKEGQHADGFVELTAQELGGAIVKPDPGPVLEPLRASVRPGDVGVLEALLDFRGLTRPEKARAFDDAPHVLQRDELEIDMDERWPVKADEEPRLANVFAGERGEQPTDAPGDGTTIAHRRHEELAMAGAPTGAVLPLSAARGGTAASREAPSASSPAASR